VKEKRKLFPTEEELRAQDERRLEEEVRGTES